MTPSLLILGRSGQLAQALAEAGEADGYTVHLLGRPDFDLTDPQEAQQRLETLYSPGDLIINAAAYTAVDRAEGAPHLARQINATTPWILAQWAAEKRARFVHISTDYVFGGNAGGPWSEDDEPCPANTYGQTKLEGEQAILRAYPGAAIIRTAGVFSSIGHNFLKTIVRMSAKSEPLRIVSDQQTGPTPANQLASIILRLARSDSTGCFHATGEPASWADLADAILLGLREKNIDVPPLERITTSEFPTRAKRPSNSVLVGQRLYNAIGPWRIDWHKGVQFYLNRIFNGISVHD